MSAASRMPGQPISGAIMTGPAVLMPWSTLTIHAGRYSCRAGRWCGLDLRSNPRPYPSPANRAAFGRPFSLPVDKQCIQPRRAPWAVGQTYRAAGRWPVAGSGSPGAPARWHLAHGQGPRPIGADDRRRDAVSAHRGPRPGLLVRRLGPCFSQIITQNFVSSLTVIYLRLKSHTLRAMFHVKHRKLRIRN